MPKKQADDGPKETPKRTAEPIDGTQTEEHLPVVGIGASAGGLEAFEQFFTNMPSDAGIAFVLIQHLDPSHKSILPELVGRYTSMKVKQVEDVMALKPNTVSVIPPNRYCYASEKGGIRWGGGIAHMKVNHVFSSWKTRFSCPRRWNDT